MNWYKQSKYSTKEIVNTNLPQKWINYLTDIPESGMGYQKVNIFFDNNSVQHDCIVFNTEIVQLPESCKDKSIVDIQLCKEKN